MSATIIEEAIHDILVADITVAAITTRVYPVTLPQDPTYPLILYMKISGERFNTLTGASGMAHPGFQVEAWAETYTEAKSLAGAVRSCLNGYRGTSGAVRIGSCLLQSERDIYENEIDCHRVVMDFTVLHDEA